MEIRNAEHLGHTQNIQQQQQQQRLSGPTVNHRHGTPGCMPGFKAIPKRLVNFILCRANAPAATSQQGRTNNTANASESASPNQSNPVITLFSASLPVSDNFANEVLTATTASVPSFHPSAPNKASTSLVTTGQSKDNAHSTALQDKSISTHAILVQRRSSGTNPSTQPSSSTKASEENLTSDPLVALARAEKQIATTLERTVNTVGESLDKLGETIEEVNKNMDARLEFIKQKRKEREEAPVEIDNDMRAFLNETAARRAKLAAARAKFDARHGTVSSSTENNQLQNVSQPDKSSGANNDEVS